MKIPVLLGLLALTSSCFAQDSTQVTTVTRASFLNPGISYEKPVGPKQTVYVQGCIGTSAYFFYSSSLGTHTNISFSPEFTAQYRYYYNFSKRQAKGKRTEMNSANYIAPVFEVYASKPYIATHNREPIYVVAAVWGLQRNFAKRFSLDFNVGPGVVFAKGIVAENGVIKKSNVTDYTTFSQLSLGFWLNKRK